MTREEIINMPPGRKMDELIHTTVICNDGFVHPFKKYSTDISAAWLVEANIDKRIGEGNLSLEHNYNFMTLERIGSYGDCWACSFDCLLSREWYDDEEIQNFKYAARGKTAPLAICRAALLAVQS